MKITDNVAISRNGFTTTLQPSGTANRAIALPDKAGVLAVITDIPATRTYYEALTPTGVNTFPLIARTPLQQAGTDISLFINGIRYTNTAGDFSVSTRTITWIPAIAGFNVDATYSVFVAYTS